MLDLVEMNQDNNITTTSKKVADTFGKEHRIIVRKVQQLLKTQPKFGGDNFGVSSYVTEQGKVLDCFEMTRDGFAMIAMSLTGTKAEEFKIKYIQAFNKMESLLSTTSTAMAQIKAKERLIEADTKAKIEEIELGALKVRIQGRLDIAKMMNQSFDINEFLTNDKASLPTHMIMDLKMAMGKEIATYGTLDLATNSLAHLLDVHGVDITAKKFNEVYLIPEGLLDTNRKVTSKGRYFGHNAIANSKTGETQPRWFDVRFAELLSYLNI